MRDSTYRTGLTSHPGGFTLLEILVAISLFAIAATTLFTTFNQMTSSVFPLTQREKRYTQAHAMLQRISQDLISLCVTPVAVYTPPDTLDGQQKDRYRISAGKRTFSGQDYSFISFASYSHLPINDDLPQIATRIQYYTDFSDTETVALKRDDTPIVFLDENNRIENDNAILVCEDILEFDIRLVDQEGTWHDQWDSDSSGYHFATPRAIALTLKIGNEEDWELFTTTVFLGVFRENNES